MIKAISQVSQRLVAFIALFFALAVAVRANVVATPSSVNFGSEWVDFATAARWVTLTNEGKSTVTISSVATSIAQFPHGKSTLPVTLGPGKRFSVAVVFKPAAAEAYSGMLDVHLASGGSVTVALSGLGERRANPPPTSSLSSSSSSLSFGNVDVSSSKSLSVTLANTGSANVTISKVTISGAGFNAAGVPSGLILAPGNSTKLTAIFAPAAARAATGRVSVTSNATNSPDSISLSGTGVATVAHSVQLSWLPSTSAVAGYNAYWSAQSGGPYSKLTSTLDSNLTYTDASVQAGTFYFVVTSVDSSNVESAYSSEVSALVP
jgi:hypothetical protein